MIIIYDYEEVLENSLRAKICLHAIIYLFASEQ